MLVPGEQPGKDKAHLDLTDPARPEPLDIAKQALVTELHHITHSARRLEPRHVSAAQRIECPGRQDSAQAANRAVGPDRVSAATAWTGHGGGHGVLPVSGTSSMTCQVISRRSCCWATSASLVTGSATSAAVLSDIQARSGP
jgi:hypothetical protein